jgi:hypothetical protein
MKANELMIGDYARVNRDGLCIKKGTIVEIRAIDADDKLTEKGLVGSAHCRPLDEDQFEGGIWCEYLEPIPLTAEILEKNGWENDFYEEEWVADYHTIRLEGYSLRDNIGELDEYLVTWCNGGINVTTDNHGCVQKDISYIHELQHALRLCGIEKEIEL